ASPLPPVETVAAGSGSDVASAGTAGDRVIASQRHDPVIAGGAEDRVGSQGQRPYGLEARDLSAYRAAQRPVGHVEPQPLELGREPIRARSADDHDSTASQPVCPDPVGAATGADP